MTIRRECTFDGIAVLCAAEGDSDSVDGQSGRAVPLGLYRNYYTGIKLLSAEARHA